MIGYTFMQLTIYIYIYASTTLCYQPTKIRTMKINMNFDDEKNPVLVVNLIDLLL